MIREDVRERKNNIQNRRTDVLKSWLFYQYRGESLFHKNRSSGLKNELCEARSENANGRVSSVPAAPGIGVLIMEAVLNIKAALVLNGWKCQD